MLRPEMKRCVANPSGRHIGQRPVSVVWQRCHICTDRKGGLRLLREKTRPEFAIRDKSLRLMRVLRPEQHRLQCDNSERFRVLFSRSCV
jgi:hypothetical protein